MIHLDAQGKIDGLLLCEPTITGASLDDALSHIKALAGATSYVVTLPSGVLQD